jgi:hypothetical protein
MKVEEQGKLSREATRKPRANRRRRKRVSLRYLRFGTDANMPASPEKPLTHGGFVFINSPHEKFRGYSCGGTAHGQDGVTIRR